MALDYSFTSKGTALSNLFVLINVLLLFIEHSTLALRTDTRSVKSCDTHSEVFRGQTFNGNEEQCKIHCWQTYISSRGGETILANKDVFQYHLKPAVLHASTKQTVQTEQCCCYYNAPWPKELVKPEFIRRKANDWVKSLGITECLPIMISVNLRRRTKNTYNELCNYLGKRRPLTMLELLKFVEDAAYLNYKQAKHPSILQTLKIKSVNKLNPEAAAEFRALFQDRLLDTQRPLEAYDGAQLSAHTLREYMRTLEKMPNALKSSLVAKAMDELIISHVLVDMTAASKHIEYVNYNELGLPSHLLEGDYDKYDRTSEEYYFALDNLNCSLLKQVQQRLETYLSTSKSLLSSLHEKLIYEAMSEKNPSLIELHKSSNIYRKLISINCK